jgi:methyl-accepting chemotaxis protein
MEEYRRRVYSWLLALPDVDVSPQRSGDRTKRSGDIQSSCATRKVNNKRNRRASIDGDFCSRLKKGEDVFQEGQGFFAKVGRMFTSLTGQPTFDDIKVVDKHICELSDLAETNAQAINLMSDRLSSFSTNMNGRLDSLEGGICEINLRVDETQEALRNITEQIYEDISELQIQLIQSQRAMDAMIRMQKYLYNISAAVRGIGLQVEQFGEGINTLLGVTFLLH